MNKEKTTAKNKLLSKLAFASADIMGGGTFNIINFLYPGFLAFACGLNAYLAGIIMLIAKLWDASIDPIIGAISDRTNSRFGKRRVYLVFVSPFMILALFMLFFPYTFPNEILRVVACLASYLLFTIIQSLIMVPYYTLASEISSDYKERASFNSYRLGFSIFSSILCVAVPGIIVDLFPNNQGYMVMSLIFGSLFAISALITGLFAKEEIVTPPLKSKFNLKDFLKPLKLKPYRQYLYLLLAVQITMAIMSGLFFFYIDFYIARDLTLNGEANMIGTIAAALMFLMQIVALPFYMWLIKKTNKMFAYQIGSFIWIVVALSLLLIPANVNPLIIFVVAAIIGFGISGPGLVPHTIFGDVADYGELYIGERIDGQMGGFGNFVNQASQALGLAIAMWIIGLAGFVEQKLGKDENGIDYPTITSQPSSAQEAIKLVMALSPLIIVTLGIIVSYTYKINAKKHAEIKELLENKNVQTQKTS